ncbi:hypothetical protein FIBSPDRAFT_1039676 [Athelia psychrophila]|uniref:Uncharacterized protein n=1 Tax=Athelia psychrophila TaxID=1759441 RepID=A0A166RGK3_9AGAM|nr:hypothetical protein FIBSPDRAFT_1039676 [Fibularhizoctonia sp. CBS 109695]
MRRAQLRRPELYAAEEQGGEAPRPCRDRGDHQGAELVVCIRAGAARAHHRREPAPQQSRHDPYLQLFLRRELALVGQVVLFPWASGHCGGCLRELEGVASLVQAEITGAGLMDEKPRGRNADGLDGNGNEGSSTVAYDCAESMRGQTHPLVPIMTIGHPRKAAYTRTSPFSFYPRLRTHTCMPSVHHHLPPRRIFAAHQQHDLLGTKNMRLDPRTRLGEADPLELKDVCAMDAVLARTFCDGEDGFLRPDRASIGKRAVHTHTVASVPHDAIITHGEVIVPHASSFDDPGYKSSVAFNGQLFKQPSVWAQVFFACRSLACWCSRLVFLAGGNLADDEAARPPRAGHRNYTLRWEERMHPRPAYAPSALVARQPPSAQRRDSCAAEGD